MSVRLCCIIAWWLIALAPAGLIAAERRTARVIAAGPADVAALSALGLDVDRVSGRSVHVYANAEEFRKAAALGYIIEWEPDPAAEQFQRLTAAGKSSGNPLEDYHDYAELTAELQSLADAHSDICRLLSAGRSVQNRELWVLKISDHVTVEEDEPEFRYLSTLHGNEPIGTELLIYLARHLLESYGTDTTITRLVDETEIYLLPLANPDGHAAGIRYNANGIDLNRNFPDRISDPDNTPTGREAETQRLMNFFGARRPVMSANFHGGSLVMNYPWDSAALPSGVYAACPDDDVFVHIAEVYSVLNVPMWNSPSFNHGITNGNDWYALFGGLQDWSYNWMGCLDLTGELSDTKWPAASALPGLWADNRDSMIAYLDECHRGVRGRVTDADTGEPVSATVTVTGRDMPFHSDPEVGDYHRRLLPDTYELRFEAPGYQPLTVGGIVVGEGPATRVDVSLEGAVELEFADIAPQELEGNGDAFPDPGESWGLELTVRNTGTATAHDVYVELTAPEAQAAVPGPGFGVGDLAPGAAAAVAATALWFQVLGEAPCAADLALVLSAESDRGAVEQPVTLPLGSDYGVQSASTDVPKAIPDHNPTGVASTIGFPPLDGVVVGVTVELSITHPYVSDLSLFLESPSGTRVELSSGNGGSGDNYSATVFDPAANRSIIAGQAPFTGRFRPEGSLEGFEGLTAGGEWRLVAVDGRWTDAGTIQHWSLELALRRCHRYATGDVNGDGIRDAADLALLAGFLAGNMPAAGVDGAEGDLDGDGRITAVDLYLLKRRF
jgi:carboxypeptidase D